MRKADIIKRARGVKAIVADVDGVLTDGGVIYTSDGKELKRFNIQDGLAANLARQAGIKIFLVSGRSSPALRKRSREMHVERLWQGTTDKSRILDIIKKEYRLNQSQICYIGDDLPDLKPLSRAGLPVAVPGAVKDVIRAAVFITKSPGGWGALRETVEIILKAQGKWKDVLKNYNSP
jgi:3-deoxy-D-manno-octulosonate 8-phosphate phosphatase (KDO 8-P phosphatase)